MSRWCHSTRVTIFFSVVEGFCDTETTEGLQGIFMWQESLANSTVNVLPCPFGPINATATRNCISPLNWDRENVSECGTVVTQQFQVLASNVSEV